MMLVGVLGGLLVFLWGRELAGGLAGICGLLLYVLDPTIVAHSHLVTMDVGVSVFALLFVFLLWRYVRVPGTLALVGCGIALGLALCAKFTAIALVPIGAVLLIASNLRRVSWRAAPEDPCPCGSGRRFKNCHAGRSAAGWDTRALSHAGIALLWIYAIALAVVVAIYRFHGPGAYLEGMTKVNADHASGYLAYMAGELAPRFTSYFAVAYLLKEPLAAIALAAAGLVYVLRRREFATRDRLFLLLPPFAFFVLHTWKADDLGIRYLIPCLPFAHLLGGIALAALWRGPSRAKRIAAAALSVWAVAAAAGIYPDGLSYFNESACLLDDPSKLGMDGGSRCGIAWLDDSNVDWGGGLKQLQTWLNANARGRVARLAYFGSFPVGAYEMPVEILQPEQLGFQPPAGLYAVSAHYVAHNSALVRRQYQRGDEWMLRVPPRAIVGHSLYVYDIGGK
jgi:hypothetical protein